MIRLILLCLAVMPLCLFTSCIEKPLKKHPKISPTEDYTIQKIQKKINKETLLVDYQWDRQQKKIWIRTINQNGFIKYDVVLNQNFEKEVKAFHQSLQQFSLPKKKNRKQFLKQSYYLYATLISPFENLLDGVENLTIISDEFLQLVPFEVLVPSQNQTHFTEVEFLIKRYNIEYQSSLTSFLNNRTSKHTPDPKVSFLGFAPVFDSKEKNSTVTSESPIAMRDRQISALPFSEIELLTINKFLTESSHLETKILLHDKANEPNLKTALSQNHKYIHIASHSFADSERPNENGILCYRSEGAERILTAEEISKMNLKADLVVLSSCESGYGNVESGDVQGIHRSFLNAGASNVIYSLWKVNDKISSQLMINFYSFLLKSGKSYSEALRLAKLKLLENSDTASPNLWAPFVLQRA
jgi:CHAT domain-containing protein